ncbi:MAG: phosphopantothenoylcysteine decarboxylase [Clostridia bacterium]|jgi:phosphopantothenoylcysteine decarboxylase/phosphopantothenate--cysteine ligase|nr:phosphopantothenoylcysteine decarboxylase [Clostridia bacterium]
MFSNKNIVLGVCGGIAAYKACELTSRLKKQSANVDVIMTKSAAEFVTSLTFQSLSLNQVVTDMFDKPKYWEIEHISLAKKADIIVIAPATANVIGKLANGIADDALTTTVMASKALKLIAPAMNTNMYENVIVQKNIELLKQLGYHFIEPGEGRLACGDIGKGKMAEPEAIEARIKELLLTNQDLQGKTVLVTAGPTREAIDPVRFITNHSTGKMGFAIAEKAAARGAKVYLVSGPSNLATPHGVDRFDVESAVNMYETVMKLKENADIIIKSAAVADYRPAEQSSEKIKKSGDELIIKLQKNPDILQELGKNKGNKVLIGFAMETQNLIENARAKVARKNLDFIVANDLRTEGAGFAGDTNVVKIIDKDGSIVEVPLLRKSELADIILDKAISVMK